MSLGHSNMWSKLVQAGTLVSIDMSCWGSGPCFLHHWLIQHLLLPSITQMAMVTITVLALPHLGDSVNKGWQRICGVMAGKP
jgi:hypothetical protein